MVPQTNGLCPKVACERIMDYGVSIAETETLNKIKSIYVYFGSDFHWVKTLIPF